MQDSLQAGCQEFGLKQAPYGHRRTLTFEQLCQEGDQPAADTETAGAASPVREATEKQRPLLCPLQAATSLLRPAFFYLTHSYDPKQAQVPPFKSLCDIKAEHDRAGLLPSKGSLWLAEVWLEALANPCYLYRAGAARCSAQKSGGGKWKAGIVQPAQGPLSHWPASTPATVWGSCPMPA